MVRIKENRGEGMSWTKTPEKKPAKVRAITGPHYLRRRRSGGIVPSFLTSVQDGVGIFTPLPLYPLGE
jgi:hypothetical protein